MSRLQSGLFDSEWCQFTWNWLLIITGDKWHRETYSLWISYTNRDTKRWTITELKAYSLIFALLKFDSMIYGRRLILVTDHSALQYIRDTRPASPKLIRWSLALSRYNIVEIRHKAGVKHGNVDSLSRLVAESEEGRGTQGSWYYLWAILWTTRWPSNQHDNKNNDDKTNIIVLWSFIYLIVYKCIIFQSIYL